MKSLEHWQDLSAVINKTLSEGGLTYRRAVKDKGISHNVVWNLASEQHEPKLQTAIDVCRALGLQITVSRRMD